MKIRKGPFGSFATLKADPGMIPFEYAMEVIDKTEGLHLLPVYLNSNFGEAELDFDCSGLIPVNEYSASDKKKDTAARRSSIGDLFLSLSGMPDLLINPALLILDADYLFTDVSGTNIYMCLKPVETKIPLRLSSMDIAKLETLLDHQFFREALAEDEITALVYAIRTNDEDLLKKTADLIISSPQEGKPANDLPGQLLYSLALACLSMILLAFPVRFISFFPAAISAVLLIKYIMHTPSEFITFKPQDGSGSDDTRTRILFDDEEARKLNCAFLESTSPVNGEVLSYAVYQDTVTIGSDRFLSDFYIKDSSVSPIHAQLSITPDTVYLSDCSANGKTYIDDRSITPETKYEVKNGQKITLGRIDFRLKVSFN
ncbi:MAG: FHA domain-containing protein [Clostridiales bacterium]|nr:FHA domain-containing protein [Clostridiales bacterium]